MSRRVQAADGVQGLLLPNGWTLDAGDTVVITDEVWTQIQSDPETLGDLVDLGSTADPANTLPTWADIQRTLTGEEESLDEHEVDTTDVHGIPNTALLETIDGAQAKADAAATAAVAAHATDTTDVHGIDDTSKLDWLQQTDIAGADPGNVLGTTDGVNWGPVNPAVAAGYEQTFNFAVADTQWIIAHGQGTKALNVEMFTPEGQRMVGDVEYPDNDTIIANWYYPTPGSARVFS